MMRVDALSNSLSATQNRLPVRSAPASVRMASGSWSMSFEAVYRMVCVGCPSTEGDRPESSCETLDAVGAMPRGKGSTQLEFRLKPLRWQV
jgi:hypothetical protein